MAQYGAETYTNDWAAPAEIPVGSGPNAAPAMDPMMMMMLMGDKGNMKDMLPLMMMNGGMGGNGAPVDPMMMMMQGEDSDMKDMLPLMMAQGGNMDPMTMMMMQGQQGGAPMDPMMMMLMDKEGDSSMK